MGGWLFYLIRAWGRTCLLTIREKETDRATAQEKMKESSVVKWSQGSCLGEPVDRRCRKSTCRTACWSVNIKSLIRDKHPGQLSFVLAPMNQIGCRSAVQRPHGCPPRGLALLLMECRLPWLKVGQGFCPEDFLLGFYKSASMTVTFMLKCHIQGPTQDQLHNC